MLGWFGRKLTFEVVADDGPVSMSVLLADASGGMIDASHPMAVSGFAAHGSSIRDGLAPLVELMGVRLVDCDGLLRSPPAEVPAVIADAELGCDADKPGGCRVQRSRAADGEVPATLAITYYDPGRDFQAGQARASGGKGGTSEARLELAAVFPAGEARQLAENALSRRLLGRDRLTLRLPPSRMSLRPGDSFQLEGTARPWMARAISIEGMAVAVEAESAPVEVMPLPADAGRPVLEPDMTIGRSRLALFELPPDGNAPGQAPLLHVAASNTGLWKSLPVEVKLGEQPMPGTVINRRSTLGQAETVLEPGTPMLFDERSQVVVRLANDSQILLNADRDALAAGANLALIGDELVQFGRAEQLGAGLFRLSSMLRGRRGTEWAASTHGTGDLFCLIEPNKLELVGLAAGTAGAVLTAVAHGVGDVAPLPEASRLVSGEAMRPPAPCHLNASRMGADIHVQWTRRSHRHWAWTDGIGDGADSFPELYRMTATGPGGETVVETAGRSIVLGPAQIPGAAGHTISLAVATVGPAALSHLAATSLTL